jgi:hypothetical protein
MQGQRKLPSIVWVFIFVGGIIALIGGIIGLFHLISNVEGVGSVIMIVVAWGIMRLFSSAAEKAAEDPMSLKADSWLKALFIIFFAGMGLAIDQTGNYLYNKPIEWLFCPSNTELARDVEVSNPVPGQTYVTQEYACINHDHQVKKEIDITAVLGVRFVEYVLIGYGLSALNRLYSRLRIRSTLPLAPDP